MLPPSFSNQNAGHPRTRIALVTLILVILAGLVSVSLMTRPSTDEPSSTFLLSPSTVSPGQQVQLTVTWKKSWADAPHGNELQIIAATGQNVAVTNEILEQRYGIQLPFNALSAAARTRASEDLRKSWSNMSGFYFGYDLATPVDADTVFVELLGCPRGLADERRQPPETSTRTYSITVLPATPPGTYTVSLPNSFWCFGDGPVGQTTLVVK